MQDTIKIEFLSTKGIIQAIILDQDGVWSGLIRSSPMTCVGILENASSSPNKRQTIVDRLARVEDGCSVLYEGIDFRIVEGEEFLLDNKEVEATVAIKWR